MAPSIVTGGRRRERLRGATSAVHQRLDRHVEQQGFFTSHPGYNAYLFRSLQARAEVEAQLDRGGVETLYPVWPARRLAPTLRLDLADLGAPASVTAAPAADTAPLSPGGVLGALYVLEGSSRGAGVLQRRAAALGFTAGFGARHLAAQTADRRAFTRFLELLDGAPLDSDEEAACVGAALGAFERFERCFGSEA